MFSYKYDKNHAIFETMSDVEKDINNDGLSSGKKSILYKRLVGLRRQFKKNEHQSFETIKINGNHLTEENFKLVQLYCLQQSLSVFDLDYFKSPSFEPIPPGVSRSKSFQDKIERAKYYCLANAIREDGNSLTKGQLAKMVLMLNEFARGFHQTATEGNKHAIKVLHNLSIMKSTVFKEPIAKANFKKLLVDNGEDLLPQYYVEDFETVKEKVRTNRSSFFSRLKVAIF